MTTNKCASQNVHFLDAYSFSLDFNFFLSKNICSIPLIQDLLIAIPDLN